MLFNSYFFILVFLPVTLAIFFFLGRRGERRAAIGWLVAVSLFFYGWWNAAYLGLIVTSILFNYSVGTILGHQKRRSAIRRGMLVFGIASNLAVLAYYKYANFFLANLNAVLGTSYGAAEIVLPLGISFFTFTQIAYLVDAWRGEAREYDFLNYALFVTYFPHLIAGPVLHHKEMMPQFGHASILRFDSLNFAAGTTYFVFGLFKKVILADGIAGFASPIFAAASRGEKLSLFDAWGGVLSYSFQLYFDFSGYCDMAIGLALMMGVRLPLNFDSPYKAVNIIDFWRRWHMTLSRFLRDYLYVALGGNKKGKVRRYANLMATMLLGGLWHGAGSTFIVWGALHGFYLVVNHGWRTLRQRLGQDLTRSSWWGRTASMLVTFLAVLVGWVYFRADSMDSAHRMLAGLLSAPDGLSPFYAKVVASSSLARWAELAGFHPGVEMLLALAVATLACIAFLAPNTQQFMGHFYWQPRGSAEALPPSVSTAWSLRGRWVLVTGSAATCALLGMSDVSEFLYFQF